MTRIRTILELVAFVALLFAAAPTQREAPPNPGSSQG